jgi:hypothetical protein
MCLACEMDQLWMLYLEQQAEAAKSAAANGGSAVATQSLPHDSTGAKAEDKIAPTCDEPASE